MRPGNRQRQRETAGPRGGHEQVVVPTTTKSCKKKKKKEPQVTGNIDGVGLAQSMQNKSSYRTKQKTKIVPVDHGAPVDDSTQRPCPDRSRVQIVPVVTATTCICQKPYIYFSHNPTTPSPSVAWRPSLPPPTKTTPLAWLTKLETISFGLPRYIISAETAGSEASPKEVDSNNLLVLDRVLETEVTLLYASVPEVHRLPPRHLWAGQ